MMIGWLVSNIIYDIVWSCQYHNDITGTMIYLLASNNDSVKIDDTGR